MYHSAISEEVGHGHEECMGKAVVSAREPFWWEGTSQCLSCGYLRS